MIDPDAIITESLATLITSRQSNTEEDSSNVEDIAPESIRLETALIVDGLQLLQLALEELPDMNRCVTDVTCSSLKGWTHGSTAINNMKMVYT